MCVWQFVSLKKNECKYLGALFKESVIWILTCYSNINLLFDLNIDLQSGGSYFTHSMVSAPIRTSWWGVHKHSAIWTQGLASLVSLLSLLVNLVTADTWNTLDQAGPTFWLPWSRFSVERTPWAMQTIFWVCLSCVRSILQSTPHCLLGTWGGGMGKGYDEQKHGMLEISCDGKITGCVRCGWTTLLYTCDWCC